MGLGVFEVINDYFKVNNKKMGFLFVIGVDLVQDWIKFGVIIVSMMKCVDVGVYNVVKQVEENKFEGGVVEFGFKEGGVKFFIIDDVKVMFNVFFEDIKKKKFQEFGFNSEDEFFQFFEEMRN